VNPPAAVGARVYTYLMSVALYVVFVVVLPSLAQFLALVAASYDHNSLTHCVLGFFSYLEYG
jgi:hypothetical protein